MSAIVSRFVSNSGSVYRRAWAAVFACVVNMLICWFLNYLFTMGVALTTTSRMMG